LVPSKHRVLLRQYTYPKPLTHKSFIERPFPKNRKDKRGYLNEVKNRDFIKKLSKYFTTTVEVPRIRRRKKEGERVNRLYRRASSWSSQAGCAFVNCIPGAEDPSAAIQHRLQKRKRVGLHSNPRGM
jgi:myo-inositol-1-phosphate synthase